MLISILLSFAALAVGLLGLAAWCTFRFHRAVARTGTPQSTRRPLPASCGIGQQLVMASAAGGGGSGARAAGGGGSRRAKKLPTRRSFLRGSMFGAMGLSLGGFGGATIAFLWPDLSGGFGAQLDVGDEETILSQIRDERAPFEFPAGRLYLVEYSPEEDRSDEYLEITDGGTSRVLAIYQRCVHLGCRVPWCETSQWFECPCHGSAYNRWGEYRDGPAGRGLDHFAVTIEGGRVIVDTAEVIQGPPRTINSLEQPREGPPCI